MRVCPHCRRAMETASLDMINQIDAIPMPRRERLVVDALLDAYPRYVSRPEIEKWAYDDVGDEANGETIHSHISKVRSKLKQHGWGIENERFVGYRLVKIEALS